MFQGTYADSINPAGAIAGDVFDDNNVSHGFLRAPDGTITTFDAPGAGTGPGQGTETGNYCGLNTAGAITGLFFDDNNAYHGFVRAPDGAITTFDVRGGGTGPGQGTWDPKINTPGDIAGVYIDTNNVYHGFVRTKQGEITKFDVPGAGTGPGQGTYPNANNPGDAIPGYYIDANNVFHGFLRIP